ncbi:hypothetical protein N4R57_19890 [Rhodobacteraceae bacterium D3-12]|nr:hypothetical protein N4R57_19890 [Rhodobacteraceae bacterium D3-12]
MSKIDFTKTKTAEAVAEQSLQQRAAQLKAECRKRILQVLGEHSLLNIQGAAIAGGLTADQLKSFQTARVWVAANQSACRVASVSGDAPDWPEVPPEVTALAAEF